MKRLLRIFFVIVCIPVIASTLVACAGNDRFIVHHSNGTVLDTKTNLMWAGTDNGSDVSWTAAKSYCENFLCRRLQRLAAADQRRAGKFV